MMLLLLPTILYFHYIRSWNIVIVRCLLIIKHFLILLKEFNKWLGKIKFKENKWLKEVRSLVLKIRLMIKWTILLLIYYLIWLVRWDFRVFLMLTLMKLQWIWYHILIYIFYCLLWLHYIALLILVFNLVNSTKYSMIYMIQNINWFNPSLVKILI